MSAKKDKSEQAAASTNGKPNDTQDVEECFVIMPISDPDGYEPGHFRRVYEDLFVPACKHAGYEAVRADKVRQTNLIHLDVLQKIIEYPMAICDLSNRNPNVMFELGLRQAFDKPVVLVQEVGTPPIFDITPLRYTEYRKEMLYRQVIEDQEGIAAAIKATREAINNSKSVNSIVKLLSLTNAASLTVISEADKDTALLQVIMAEIGNLRTEISDSLRHKDRNVRARVVARRGSVKDLITRQEIEALDSQLKIIEDGIVSFALTGTSEPELRKKIYMANDRYSGLVDWIGDEVTDESINRSLADIQSRLVRSGKDIKKLERAIMKRDEQSQE